MSQAVNLLSYSRRRYEQMQPSSYVLGVGKTGAAGPNGKIKSAFDHFDFPRDRMRGATDRRPTKAAEVLCHLAQRTVAEKRKIYARLEEIAWETLFLEEDCGGGAKTSGEGSLRTRGKDHGVEVANFALLNEDEDAEGAAGSAALRSFYLAEQDPSGRTGEESGRSTGSRSTEDWTSEDDKSTLVHARELVETLMREFQVLRGPATEADEVVEHVPLEWWHDAPSIAEQYEEALMRVVARLDEVIEEQRRSRNGQQQGEGVEQGLSGELEESHKDNNEQFEASSLLLRRLLFLQLQKRLKEEAYSLRIAEIGIFQAKTTLAFLEKCGLPGWISLQYHAVDPWLDEMNEFRLMAEVVDVESDADTVFREVIQKFVQFTTAEEKENNIELGSTDSVRLGASSISPSTAEGAAGAPTPEQARPSSTHPSRTPTSKKVHHPHPNKNPIPPNHDQRNNRNYIVTPSELLRRNRQQYGKHVKGPFVISEFQRVPRDAKGLFVHRRNSLKATHNMEDLDIVFLDGDHSLQGFLQDMYAYAAKTQHYASGHDFNIGNFPGIGLSLLHSRVPGTMPYNAFGHRYANSTIFMDSDYCWWMRVGQDKTH
ncbi:unnamed protein product [Amoebophrya sp. A25]|nr:unnamed protein product [Amoebophrya sp. A25]|eukprot:GSA25T00011022001.1